MAVLNRTQAKILQAIIDNNGRFFMPKFLSKRDWAAAMQLVDRGVIVKADVELNIDGEEGGAYFEFA